MVVAAIYTNYEAQNQKKNTFISDYGHWAVDPLPPNTILLTKGDLICNSIIYLQICEGVRPDVKMLSLEHMTYPWFTRHHDVLFPGVVFPADRYHPSRPDGYSIGWFIDVNLPRFPIFIAGGLKENDLSFFPKYKEAPYALTTRVIKAFVSFSFHINRSDQIRRKEKTEREGNENKKRGRFGRRKGNRESDGRDAIRKGFGFIDREIRTRNVGMGRDVGLLSCPTCSRFDVPR